MVNIPTGLQTPEDQPITNPDPNPPGVTRQNWMSRPVTRNLGLTGPFTFLTPPSP
jgi:hypothetical protein